jgi:hypothetical protein
VQSGPPVEKLLVKETNIGSSVDSWLHEERIYEAVSAAAIKRVVSRQVEAAMGDSYHAAKGSRLLGRERRGGKDKKIS